MRITILIFIALSFFSKNIFSQDIILLRTGEEIKSKVEEIDKSTVKYKKFENLSGPTYIIKVDLIFMIKYENGTKDIFDISRTSSKEEKASENSYVPNESVDYKKKDKRFREDFSNTIFLGGGSTVGGPIGLYYDYSLLPKFSFIVGFSILENSFEESIGYGVGLRFYSSNLKSYFSIVYGTGSHSEHGMDTNWQNNYLMGFSIMYGYRLYIIDHLSIDIELGGRYVTEKMFTDLPPFFIAGGVGIAFHF